MNKYSDERERVRAHLRHAIAIIGSQGKLGAIVGRTQQNISYALRTGRVNPIIAFKIADAVNGAIRPESLCPELRQRRNSQQPAVRF